MRGKQGLARTGRPDHQDVALLDLDFRVRILDAAWRFLVAKRRLSHFLENALVMVVNGDGQRLLGVLLADAMLVELALDFGRLGNVDALRDAFWDWACQLLVQTFLQRTTQLSQM